MLCYQYIYIRSYILTNIYLINRNKNNIMKKVLITGHTGFKGSWLTMWLNILGARVAGISNSFPSSLNHYKL